MAKIRRSYPKAFKVKVASEALGGSKTLSQLSSEHGVHPSQIKEWKSQALEVLNERFGQRRGRKKQEMEERFLYEEIGRLKVELDFLSSKLGS